MNGLIVSGGIVDGEQLKDLWIKLDHPYVMGVDRGCVYLMENSIPLDKAVGDFDSINENERIVIEKFFDTEKLQCEKDDTDTEHALKMMLDMDVSKIIMMGCTGSRLDHTFAAIKLLRLAVDKGVDAFIIDKNNRIRVAKGTTILSKTDSFGKYVSVLPYDAGIASFTAHGFKYEVTNISLDGTVARGVSNELVRDVGMITCDDYYILMETID